MHGHWLVCFLRKMLIADKAFLLLILVYFWYFVLHLLEISTFKAGDVAPVLS